MASLKAWFNVEVASVCFERAMHRLVERYDGWSREESEYDWDAVQDSMHALTQTRSRTMEIYHRDVDSMGLESKRTRKELEGKKAMLEDELCQQEQGITLLFEEVAMIQDKWAIEVAIAKEEMDQQGLIRM
ncbi:hypothetical protein GOP47_0010879 [Adiantum capillus-veneris]|uniref:Uncharacterized protein n=1 Tax=Adiantum capillus-veneris TaxID=13818 RepID=A0A9D4ZGS6_ADICA|nr:hypothetical protein GOP47_0010879 [Adiantum capillus-veneris]